MSAGHTDPSLTVSRDELLLAPKFRAAVDATIAACEELGMDPFVYEAYRSPQLAALYFKRGRPPTREYPRPVTNAPTNLYTWHGFGLAVDIISKSKQWDAGEEWFQHLADVAKMHGLKWGGDWKMRDVPHVQWGKCRASPSDRARAAFTTGGFPAIWQLVEAA